MAVYEMPDEAKWYVVHTYSGYENKVKANLEKIVENRNLHDYIFDIVVPMEEQIEIKDGRKKATLRKVFPGYVLVKMIMTDESGYVVRNTRESQALWDPDPSPCRFPTRKCAIWVSRSLPPYLIMRSMTA